MPNNSKISVLLEYPIALNRVVTGNFFRLSISANKASLISVVKSTHDPRNGIILAE